MIQKLLFTEQHIVVRSVLIGLLLKKKDLLIRISGFQLLSQHIQDQQKPRGGMMLQRLYLIDHITKSISTRNCVHQMYIYVHKAYDVM